MQNYNPWLEFDKSYFVTYFHQKQPLLQNLCQQKIRIQYHVCGFQNFITQRGTARINA